MKKLGKVLLYILLGIFIALALISIKELLFTEDKLKQLRSDLIYNYYEEAKLQEIMKEELGEAYEGMIQEDFNNFVVSVVLNKLAEYETEKNERYNSFLSKTEMAELEENWLEEASNTEGYSLGDDIYFLNIDSFLNGETYKRVESYVPEMKEHSYLIVDLRHNSGGHLQEANKIISLFLEQGTTMYSLKTSDKLKHELASGKEQLSFEKIVLLMNERTASAAELFILALEGNLEQVTLLGTQTYGKNISFALRKFHDKSAMIFINSIMQGPTGTQYPDGLVPDIYQEPMELNGEGDVASSEVADSQLPLESDAQLQRAIQFIKE